MKTLLTLVVAVIFAGWIGGVAILSVQNFTPVTFKFLTLQSVEIPLGIVLALSAGLGAIGGAIAPLLLAPRFPDEE